jgi:hypothetical protein
LSFGHRGITRRRREAEEAALEELKRELLLKRVAAIMGVNISDQGRLHLQICSGRRRRRVPDIRLDQKTWRDSSVQRLRKGSCPHSRDAMEIVLLTFKVKDEKDEN